MGFSLSMNGFDMANTALVVNQPRSFRVVHKIPSLCDLQDFGNGSSKLTHQFDEFIAAYF